MSLLGRLTLAAVIPSAWGRVVDASRSLNLTADLLLMRHESLKLLTSPAAGKVLLLLPCVL